MPGEIDLTRGWLLKADSDLHTTRALLNAGGPYDTACFHTQQAIEKLLKALLAFAGAPIPRTHNLEDLVDQCERALPGWVVPDVDVANLTPYAIELRYDFDFWPDRETAAQALRDAELVRAAVLGALPDAAKPR